MAQYKLLIVKTSSLGDVVHMLPALTDIHTQHPDWQIDWVVEENFAEIPRWHPAIHQVFPVAIRRWRKSLFHKDTRQEISTFKQELASTPYDVILDAQGLIKSALISYWAKGKRVGFDFAYAREPLASLAYQQRLAISKNEHAIKRNRLLTAGSLDYSISNMPLDYGLQLPASTPPAEHYLLALHGTSRPDKEWPLAQWQTLFQSLATKGLKVYLPWGNQREFERANALAQQFEHVRVLPKSTLTELAHYLVGAVGVIGMDTGLMHLAAALGKSGVALYPTTYPELTGVLCASESKSKMSVFAGSEVQNTPLILQALLTNLAIPL
ncbi:lipopolysaccharide heptosyltransferase I [Thiofilum flexile]|uniref:lipopolysaccharide heptosyltransferase I n=1 Tax=Thiofilum flexile TaxID=125627 RepID=UPI000369C6B5|nr:lipopolysaccharide heptosyltransferase I [Thiofilum flexile]